MLNHLRISTIVLTSLSVIVSANFAAAGALNQSIKTPNHDYKVKYHDKDADDPDFFPQSRAQDVADALDNALTPLTGAPNGHHDGFTDRTFFAPHFDGNNTVKIEQYEDENGPVPSFRGVADYAEIVINTDWAKGSTESCLRKVTGHELFHHVEFAYMPKSKLFGWSDFLIEGMARAMEDKIFSDLDAGACTHYLSEVAAIQSTPNFPLWARDYDAALFWNYLSEQYGVEATEPHVGVDFFEKYWRNAMDEDSNLIANLEETFANYNETLPLEEIFRDYTIANVAREFDLSLIPDADRYRYVDEPGAPAARTYQDVAKVSAAFPISSSVDVAFWGAAYITTDVPNTCSGVVGFTAQSQQGDAAGYNLLAIRKGAVERIDKGTFNTTLDNSFAVALPYDAANPWEQLIAVIQGFDPGTLTSGALTSLDLVADVDFAFDCGPATLSILTPTASLPAWVGDVSAPDRFNVIVSLNGPASLGDAFVEGLDADDFSVFVGAQSLDNEATVLAGREAGGLFTLTVQPPVKASGVSFPLTVNYGSIASATNADAVRYESLVIDEIILLDRSDSMNDPVSDPKITAARAIGRMDINSAQSDDQIGVVSFNGNGFFMEPSNTGIVEYALTPVDSSSRPAAVVAMNSVLATGATSIGDGLFTAIGEIGANGVADGEDWIVLLSDGAENEARYYVDVRNNLIASGIRVFAIAFGGHADQPLLQRIAEDTNGAYLHVPLGGASRAAAGGADTTLDLADAFVTARGVMRGHERLFEARATGANVDTIDVGGSGVGAGRFTLQWNNDTAVLDATITRPDGTPLADGVDGVTLLADSQHLIAHVPFVEAGEWSVSTSVLSGSADYLLTLTGKSRDGVQLELDFDQDGVDPSIVAQGGTYQRGLPMRIIAVLTDSAGPVANAAVKATVTHPEAGASALTLHDDGKHGDGKANDGVYANVYATITDGSATSIADNPSLPPDDGSYGVTITVVGTDSLGNRFTRTRKGGFAVLEPDGSEDDDFDGLVNIFEDSHGCLRRGFNDALRDEDGDQLTNVDEYLAGTDPCNADTDQGGETDGSELARGGNPLDRADDALARPLDVGIVKARGDALSLLDSTATGNLIRYPVDPDYASIQVLSAGAPGGPFTPIASFAPATNGGLFRHANAPLGVEVFYYVVAMDINGNRSAASRIVSAVANADPVAPGGFVSIAGGRPVTDSASVALRLGSSHDTVSMLVSNEASFDGVVAIPYTQTLNWTLAPSGPDNMAYVFVRFIDAAGNRSLTASDGVAVDANASFGSISGAVSLAGAIDNGGALVSLLDVATAAPVLTNMLGDFSMGDVPAGTYDILVERNGYVSATIQSVTVSAGVDTPLGLTVLAAIDADGDGVLDPYDNCQLHANPAQTDSDGDRIGNRCDPDIRQPNDCVVNILDLAALRAARFTVPGDLNWNPDADLSGDNRVNVIDLGMMRQFAFGAPGPSGYDNVCE